MTRREEGNGVIGEELMTSSDGKEEFHEKPPGPPSTRTSTRATLSCTAHRGVRLQHSIHPHQ